MITEIGCTNDGGIWLKLLIEVNGVQQIGILPMDAKQAVKLRSYIDKAIEQGQRWVKTGVKPIDSPDLPEIDGIQQDVKA